MYNSVWLAAETSDRLATPTRPWLVRAFRREPQIVYDHSLCLQEPGLSSSCQPWPAAGTRAPDVDGITRSARHELRPEGDGRSRAWLYMYNPGERRSPQLYMYNHYLGWMSWYRSINSLQAARSARPLTASAPQLVRSLSPRQHGCLS